MTFGNSSANRFSDSINIVLDAGSAGVSVTNNVSTVTVGLRVTDGGGQTDTVSITNVAPIANAWPKQSVFRNKTVNCRYNRS